MYMYVACILSCALYCVYFVEVCTVNYMFVTVVTIIFTYKINYVLFCLCFWLLWSKFLKRMLQIYILGSIYRFKLINLCSHHMLHFHKVHVLHLLFTGWPKYFPFEIKS